MTPPTRPPEDPEGPRALLRRNAWPMALAACATLGVELGTYFLARGAGAASREALLAALAAAAMWVALASPAMAAGATGCWEAALRGGVPADASLVALGALALLARQPDSPASYLGLAGAAKAYCVLAAMSLLSIAAACVARGPAGRRAMALASALLMAAAITSPFWTGGLLASVPYPAGRAVVAWAVHANPFYGLTGAAVDRLRFFWQEWGLMYERIGRFSDYPSPPLRWYAPALIWGALAAVAAAAAALRRLRACPRP